MRYAKTILLLLLLLTAGCDDRQLDNVLATADSLITASPDSAFHYLEAHSTLKPEGSRSQRMRYELLRATAQNKAYIDFTTDSVMKEVVAYYDDHGTANEQLQAHYLLGCAYRDLGDAPLALQIYQDAIEKADTTKDDCDYNTLSAICGQMADIFHQQYLPEDELSVLSLMGEYQRKNNNDFGVLRANELKIRPYFLMGDTDSVISISRKAYMQYLENGYETESARCLGTLIDILLDQKQNDEAGQCMTFYESKTGFFINGIIPHGHFFHYEKGRYALSSNEKDSALFHFRELLGSYDEAAYKGLFEVYKKGNNADSIAKYAALYVAANDSARRSTSSEIVHRMSAMYNYSRHQRLAEQRERELAETRRNAAIGIVILLLALCLIAYFNKSYQKKKRMEINALTRNLIAAEEELEKARKVRSMEKDIETLKLQLAALSQEKAQIKKEDLEKAFYETPIYKTFHHLSVYRLNQIPPTESDWEEMTQQFVHYFPTYSSFINHQNILPPDQIHYAMLVRLSFSDQEIGIIMNKDRKRINNIKALINEKFWSEKSAKTLRERLNGQF